MTDNAPLAEATESDPSLIWPGEDTLVLLNRPLVPGADVKRLSRFGDPRWRLTDAVFEQHAPALNLNFEAIPDVWRFAAKYYIWQLINRDYPQPARHGMSERASIQTILTAFPDFKIFVKWLHHRELTAFGQVTDDLLDEYLAHVGDEPISLASKYTRVKEVRRVWHYRSVLPERMQLPTRQPWGGDPARELFGKTRRPTENLTPRIAEATMQALLLWSLRFVEELAPDILAANSEYLRLKSRTPERRRLRGDVPCRPPKGDVERAMRAYIDRVRQAGAELPGQVDLEGRRRIDWRHVGMILEYSLTSKTPQSPAGQLLVQARLPIADDAYLDTPIAAQIGGKIWRKGQISYTEVPLLARHLSTACLIVVAYLSGARPGEILNLRRGCIERDEDADMWLMSGVFFKNAIDSLGNKVPAGAERRDPWVVVKPVADAVNALEQLHSHSLLFPSKLEPYRQERGFSRVGEARSAYKATTNIHEFIDWVNRYANQREMDGVPIDNRGNISISRFRRTLAWFIRRRPRGLIAGSLQYGHVHTRLIQGYAGSYNSGFPDEYAYEHFLSRLDELAADQDALDAGEHVSGPAADRYRQRVTGAQARFAGHVLTSGRQARDLLSNPLLQIHHGDGVTCVFNALEAACQLRGGADDPMVTPDIDDCRPRCPNIARTDRDIEAVRARRDRLEEIISDALAPPIRHQREQIELQRLNAILEKHREEE